jgi:hypothetical protein
MLKLSGWPRLTWGRVARAALPGVGGRPLGVPVRPRGAGRGARRPACTVSRASVHHSSRPASAGGPLLSPPRSSPVGGESPGGPLSASARRAGPVRGATRGVTPRQACPRPGGLGRNLRSKTRWFAGFCNSHQVSHFATFFIDARAEISVAESRFGICTTVVGWGAPGARPADGGAAPCAP